MIQDLHRLKGQHHSKSVHKSPTWVAQLPSVLVILALHEWTQKSLILIRQETGCVKHRHDLVLLSMSNLMTQDLLEKIHVVFYSH